MTSGTGELTLSQLEARTLAGKSWAFNGRHYRFADYVPNAPGDPPWRSGAEGIAYPLLGPAGEPAAYLKFFNPENMSGKRVRRTRWLIAQRLHEWGPELRGTPRQWVDTRSTGRPQGVTFHFTCSLAEAVPGKTWAEWKWEIEAGAFKPDEAFRLRCSENLLRALVILDRHDLVHGDLSPNNVVINPQARSGEPVLYLIDFDGFAAAAAGLFGRLSAGEKGTFGTAGYCPPDLVRRAQQDKFTAIPYSDRYGRDMLLLELLCFDEDCPPEDPPEQWPREQIESGLSRISAASTLAYLKSADLFRLPENRRPPHEEVARALGIRTPPRMKRRTVAMPLKRDLLELLQAATVYILWLLCSAVCLVVSWRLAGLLLPSSAATGGSNSLLPAALHSVLFLALAAGGLLGLTILAYAEKDPQEVQLSGIRIRLPARWSYRNNVKEQFLITAGQLLAAFGILSAAAMILGG